MDRYSRYKALVYEEAARWCVRLAETPVGRATRMEFADWLRHSPCHLDAYLETVSVWHSAASIGPDVEIDDADHPDNPDESILTLPESACPGSVGGARFIGHKWLPLTASLLLVAGVAILAAAIHWPSVPAEYRTTKGEQFSFVMSDGTIVHLNTESEIVVKEFGDVRRIDLLRGEVLFEVARDPGRPFVVTSDGATVRVLGTRFNVERKDTGTTVTVVEGEVAVSVTGGALKARAMHGTEALRPNEAAPKGSDIRLVDGEQIVVRRGAASMERRSANVGQVLAWRQRRLVFESESLDRVVNEFNRYNVQSLEIRDPELTGIRISGVFNADDPASLLDYLRQYENIEVTHQAKEKKYLLASRIH